jgi:NAD(P)-dependent dehydrogenase (short-subunit alcohol dehydrogenase family)
MSPDRKSGIMIFKWRVALITCASGGIGAVTARMFAAGGAAVESLALDGAFHMRGILAI